MIRGNAIYPMVHYWVIFLDETEAESDAESDLSDHEDFYLPGEDHNVKMEVSATRRENIKQLFYSDQVLPYTFSDWALFDQH